MSVVEVGYIKGEVIHILNRQCRLTPSIITIVTWTRLTVVLCFSVFIMCFDYA